MSTERYHHPYSPSQLNSIEACPCYRSKESHHERTVAGSIAHESAEKKVIDARLSDEDSEAVAESIDFTEARKQLMQIEASQQKQSATAVTELKEVYLPIDDAVFPDCNSTTAGWIDHALINYNATYAEIIDFKFGYWSVESALNNLQALAYMLGMFKKYPTLQRIKFFFKLPNIDKVDSCELTRDQIPAVYLRIQTVVARARKARETGSFETANPMVPLCSFCSRLGDCPKVEALMIKVAQKFYPLEFPADITPTKIHDRHNTRLALNLAATAKAWAESYRSRVTDRVLRGDAEIPEGHKIETRKGDRKVVDPIAFKRVTLNYLTEAEYASVCDVPGFGKLEAIITEKSPKGSKKSTLVAFADMLEKEHAVARGEKYSFLKVVNDREKSKQNKQNESNE